jgi:hypothetical protein
MKKKWKSKTTTTIDVGYIKQIILYDISDNNI